MNPGLQNHKTTERSTSRYASHVSSENLRQTLLFIDACRTTALEDLANEAEPEGSFFLGEVLNSVIPAFADLVRAGDLGLLRKIRPCVERLTAAGGPGAKFVADGPSPKRESAAQILKQVKLDVIVRALHALPQGGQSEALTEDQRKRIANVLESRNSSKVEKVLKNLVYHKKPTFLLGEECALLRILRRDHQRRILQKYYGSPIENLWDRDWQRRNINTFAEYLRRGWLWNDGFHRCPWNARPSRKALAEFLRTQTSNVPSQLRVFRYFLARRGPVLAGESLIDDKPEYAYDQIVTRIEEAWETLETKRIPRPKRASGKKQKTP